MPMVGPTKSFANKLAKRHKNTLLLVNTTGYSNVLMLMLVNIHRRKLVPRVNDNHEHYSSCCQYRREPILGSGPVLDHFPLL